MSGIEIVLIIAAGYAINKKVKDHKRKKLAAAGLLPEQHGPVELVTPTTRTIQHRRHRGHAPDEELEPLPLYSPPTDDLKPKDSDADEVHLPSYEEIQERKRQDGEDHNASPFGDAAATEETESVIATSSSSTPLGTRSHQ